MSSINPNKFYLGKEVPIYLIPNYTYDLNTGDLVQSEDKYAIDTINVSNVGRVYLDIGKMHTAAVILMWGESNAFLGYKYLYADNGPYMDFEISEEIKYIAFTWATGTLIQRSIDTNIRMLYEVIPHYKKLNKKYSKENGQVFFRQSIDGKINLYGTDYLLVNSALLEETLYFYVYKRDKLFAVSSFNKSDCKFDHCKKNVELKLTFSDKYSKILDAYENTYDLIKLAPELTQIALTKRCVVQIYIQGEKTLSNYAGGTYWETDVDEQVDDENALLRKYYFSKGPRYIEIDLEGFNSDINAAYRGLPGSNIWNATSSVTEVINGQEVRQKVQACIVFKKVFDARSLLPGYVSRTDVHLLSNDSIGGVSASENAYFLYDAYRIEIRAGRDGDGTVLYTSTKIYCKDKDFSIAVGDGLYPMISATNGLTPSAFNLGENVIEYQIWGRMLCDVDSVSDGQGGYIETYDLPRDDFATPRRNYRKCIGLTGFDSPNSVVSIWQNENTTDNPTSYGMNDFGEYFIPPYTLQGQYFYPLARSSWANISLWVMLGNSIGIDIFETFCAKYYREYSIKDVCHIGDAIKALLKKIDPLIKHEKTSQYSSFLYGHSGATASVLGNCDLYITQKTNILKGEYDQAAQKAEIKFKQIMDMLRDCFRCYWFIDEQNRFRIEHISYFMNGFSYDSPLIQLDLTLKNDKFNKKKALYCQQEIEYDKSDLISRYEFAYMDDVTKAMGGDFYIDVNNKYIQKNKTEEINIDGFTADIDYMLFLPDNFSNDGFALIMAGSDKKIPIVHQLIKDEKQYNRTFGIYVQNWYASFNQLAWHYMDDISGNNIEYNNVEYLYSNGVKRCMKHNIEFTASNISIDLNKLIKTEIGNGYIEEVTINIDTEMAEIELRYEPE